MLWRVNRWKPKMLQQMKASDSADLFVENPNEIVPLHLTTYKDFCLPQ